MGWTSKMRANKYPKSFNTNGKYKGGIQASVKINEVNKEVSDDTQNRKNILNEIKERVSQGEEIDIVVSEIAQREEVKKQFKYFEKNGITDLETIFKSWYNGYVKNKETSQKFNNSIVGR